MQENHLFEYAVMRIVPKVEREEFINVGVILFCAKQKFLHVKFDFHEDRLQAMCPSAELQLWKEYLHAVERICMGSSNSGPIGKLSMAERFRWLTATRSSVLQTSKVHPGLCVDASKTLDKLFNQLVV